LKKLLSNSRLVLFVSILLCAVTLCTVIVHANNSPNIYVNGNLISTPSYIQDGVTYVPLRAVSENMGAAVSWNQEEYSAYVDFSSGGSIPNIISAVSPSVVAIAGNYRNGSYTSQYSDSIAHGAGVVIKSGGEILTNAHVVKDIDNITVILQDGSSYRGKVKYIDEPSDLAVVKIDKLGLRPITFATEADIIVGATVIAIGTPISLSLRNSASAGIISGMNRGIDSDYALIQTDAAINPGNSGGPLVNISGKLVGINSSKYAGVGIEGMGFSIPIDTVTYVLAQFEAHGKVMRPNIGAKFEESWEARHGLPTTNGISIKSLTDGMPAQQAGLVAGDTIVAINGFAIHSIVEWNEAVKMFDVGGSYALTVKRGEETISVTVTPIFN